MRTLGAHTERGIGALVYSPRPKHRNPPFRRGVGSWDEGVGLLHVSWISGAVPVAVAIVSGGDQRGVRSPLLAAWSTAACGR